MSHDVALTHHSKSHEFPRWPAKDPPLFAYSFPDRSGPHPQDETLLLLPLPHGGHNILEQGEIRGTLATVCYASSSFLTFLERVSYDALWYLGINVNKVIDMVLRTSCLAREEGCSLHVTVFYMFLIF